MARSGLPALLTLLLFGCAADPMPAIRQAFYDGDYQQAQRKLVALENDDAGNHQLYQLEEGIVDLALHDPVRSERVLRAARDRLDDLARTDVLSWLGAVLLDDRQLDYAGADYEQVLVRAVLAVANLMHDGRDADAFALQVLERQQQIIESFTDEQGYRPKKAYKLVAFGSYLRAILNEDDPLHLGVARQEYRKVKLLEPAFPFADADLERVTHGQHSRKGNGVVHVLAFVGRGPFRVEADEPVSAQVLAIAQVIWAHSRRHFTFPNITAVKIPAMSYWRDNPTEVHVFADGNDIGPTAVITDVERTASKEFEAMKSYIVARAVLRRAFKIAVTEGAKEAIHRGNKRDDGDDNLLADLGISLAGILWTAAERADLRSWSLLPASFQVLRVELPAGRHELTFRAGRGGRPTGREQGISVLVRDGLNSYVLIMAPTLAGGPPPLTSEPVLVEKPQ